MMTDGHDERNEGRVMLRFDYLPCVNYSMVSSGVETCKTFILENRDERDWQQLTVRLTGSAVEDCVVHVDSLPRGGSVQLRSVRIVPDVSVLTETTEAVSSVFTLRITEGDDELWNQEYAISLLAYDQWVGTSMMPELISAFVVPNNPVLSPVLVQTGRLLEQLTGSSALDEYQTQDRNRVRQQVAALYEALRAEGIVYSTPSASFEQFGQRVRLADRVLTEKLGTCIDTTLLMASCLEKIGINPIIVMFGGHALVGAWLTSKVCPQMVCDDASLLLKEMADGNHNVVLVETTAITSSSRVSFEDAVEQAARRLGDERDFLYFVDVRRCRLGHIRPLPQRVQKDGVWAFDTAGVEHEQATDTVNSLSHYDLRLDDSNVTMTKQLLWERKLLDFSLRNNLLNTRLGKRVVPFISFGIERLEDHLQKGEDYQVTPSPGPKIEPNQYGMYDSHNQASEHQQLVQELIQDNKIASYLTEAELQNALKYVYRTARTAIEENGANSLFLALGMLKWYETAKSEQPRFAPILLLPVDIIRKAGNHFIIRKRDEDIIPNITLVELLKQNFSIRLDGLKNLPKDESGVDVKMIFTMIRRAIIEQKKWDVLEESMLGLFSFNKFVMWNDIHTNADKLEENPVIAALTGKDHSLGTDADDRVDARQIDKTSAPLDFAIPLDVDSSQMEAVVESGRGKSFILHGPPGTGKSQTITNMIANALFQGKRVLFVAEKMAALSVVQARLEKVGLAPFCLELHSNKVTKKHFLEQMEMVLNAKKIKSPEAYPQASDELFAERKELIAYMEALHHRPANGLSLYDCISEYLLIEGRELEQLGVAPERLTADFMARCRSTVADMEAVTNLAGLPANHPLAGLEPTDNKMSTLDDIKATLTDADQLTGLYAEQQRDMKRVVALDLTTEADMQWLTRLADVVGRCETMNTALTVLADDDAQRTVLKGLVDLGRNCEQMLADIKTKYDEDIVKIDAGAERRRWNEIQTKWLLPRFLAKRSFLKSLRQYGSVAEDDVPQLLGTIADYQQKRAKYDAAADTLKQYFGALATTGQEQWQPMDDVLKALPQIGALAAEIARKRSLSYADCLNMLTQPTDGQWKLHRRDFISAAEPLLKTYRSLAALTSRLAALTTGGLTVDGVVQSAGRWAANYDGMRDWYHWVDMKRQLKAEGLAAVVAEMEQQELSPQAAMDAFMKGAYHQLIALTIDGNPQLRKFNGMLFRQQIEKYKQNTQRFQELSKEELYCRLAAQVPSAATASADGSEVSILKRNIANGGRGSSIRSIIDSIPTLLPRLCPCMLMSPLSVAQFLDLNNEKFDLVIFDEASQMPTSEAVGAIARGKALIVVGDSKQMPPTSFFVSSQVDEDEAELDDMESILDDCRTLSMSEYYLSWHYRSKHESLIAFSNSQYYDNKLLTFPSVDDQDVKVRMVKVNGKYDKGRTRSNPEEARAIVDEVMRRLADDELKRLSIGIVSFSKVQQNLIEDILSEELDKHPALKDVAQNGKEPIFIKNLENVQGDERDVILFSVGYGPDKSGKVSMNFGPLNNSGGERRLNVAVSRARYEMIVFSTLTAADIDLRRSNAKGVEGLKGFLEFAENGRLPIVPTANGGQEWQSVLVNEISQAIAEQGYQVTPFVGRSNFKIDMAVSSKKHPEQYILGILCDGRNYYETKTTRDREIVQPSVLHMLHWRTMRVYSIDWYENRQRVMSQILDELKQAESGRPVTVKRATKAPAYTFSVDNIKEKSVVRGPMRDERLRNYVELEVDVVGIDKSNYRPDGSYNKRMIRKILEMEQPIVESYLCKRVAKVFGFSYASVNIQRAVEQVLPSFYRQPQMNGGYCVWLDKLSADSYTSYRAPSPRTITEIPDIEIANAVLEVITEEFSLPKTKIPPLVTRKLGFTNCGPKMNEIILALLTRMEHDGKVKTNLISGVECLTIAASTLS